MFRQLSLTRRLTLFFTLVVVGIILGLGWLFMVAADRHFVDLDQMALNDKRHLIEEILREAPTRHDLQSRLKQSLDHHHGLYVHIQNGQGHTIFHSSNAQHSPNFHIQEAGNVAPNISTWKVGHTEFRGLSFANTPHHLPQQPLHVTVAFDIAHHQQFIIDLQHSLVVYALIATLLSGMLGWLAAHQGMAPLRAMKKRAAAVSGQRLGERMPVEAVPIEMADLAQELNRMLDRLQQDFRRLSDFSSDLAHELRTPISNLLTQTEVALSSRRDANTYRDILASNAEELQRLGRMVADMLFLAKTERGVDLPNKEHFSAAHEVEALLDFYDALAEEKHVRLSMEGDGPIHGDRLMFRQGVSNLLSNALRHTPDGGSVTVNMTHTPQAVEVTVQNTGADIPADIQPRLFDRFYRADPARTHPASDGAGLGLSITKAIVEAHGGSASVHSAAGTTRFCLRFPLR